MKKNTMRLLSLMLTLVMLLGAVPFASAATADGAEIEVSPTGAVWPGETVELVLDTNSLTGYNISDIKWFKGEETTATGTGTVLNYTVNEATTMTAKYQATPTAGGSAVEGKSTVSLSTKNASESSIAITGLPETTYVGAKVSLKVSGGGESDIEWTVEAGNAATDASKASAEDGVFIASATGTYKLTATATNDPNNNSDDITSAAKTIKVEEATYTAELADKTILINNKTTQLVPVAKANGTTVTPKSVTYSVTDTTILTVGTDGTVTPIKAGYTTVTATVTFDDGTTNGVTKTTNAAIITITDAGIIMLEQDGKVTDDDEMELEFYVSGPTSSQEVDWSFTVRALNISNSTDKSSPYFVWSDSSKSDRRSYTTEEDGPSIDVDLEAQKGYGIAVITADASWGSGTSAQTASGTFYVSFYDEVDISVTLKDTVDEFDWDEEDVFSAVKVGSSSHTATVVKKDTLADLLTLAAGEYIDLDEGNDEDDNKDVGEITGETIYDKDYDPEKVNTIYMDELDDFSFEADDEGIYYIEYKQYDTVSGYTNDFVIGEGTLKIIVGDVTDSDGDVSYTVANKGEITLSEDDFEDYWKDEDMDDEDTFEYVVFTGCTDTSVIGGLYREDGEKSMRKSDKFFFEYKSSDEDEGYDLDEVVYKASSTTSNYVDEIAFVCYGEDGETLKGTMVITVGSGNSSTTTTGTMAFTDVKSTDWYYESVKYVYEQGIMAGTTTTKFSPDTNLTRGMIVTMLYRVEGEPTVTATNKFSDVKAADYYYDAVRWAADKGIVNGTTDTTFSPTTNITRQDLATILYRYVKEYKGQTAATGTLTGFSDASQVSDYASSAMKWAVAAGIINGISGALQPAGNATRAQAATMFQRLLAN